MEISLTFLGSGSAFYIDENISKGLLPENWQSNMLLEIDGKKLLIDCGTDIRFSLKESGNNISDIDSIYLSHPHADHVGGLEYFAFSTYFNPNYKKPNLILSSQFVKELWEHTLKGGLESLQTHVATLSTYFNLIKVKANKTFKWQNIEFTLVQTVHVMNGFSIAPSFGLLFSMPSGKTIFITTDTQYCPHQIFDFYKKADLIFHDCETSFRSGVHAHYNDLVSLPCEIKKKMWLYHYQPNYKDFSPENDGFNGFIKKGQKFDLNII